MCVGTSSVGSSCFVSTLKFHLGVFLLLGYFKTFLPFCTGCLLFSCNQGKMTAILQSQLNPLATTFIPGSGQTFENENLIDWVNEAKTALDRRNLNLKDRKTTWKRPEKFVLKDFTQDKLLCKVSMLPRGTYPKRLDVCSGSQLCTLSEIPKDYKEQKFNADPAEPTKIEDENVCICPPMFGWSVPPDFIGNPFNYKYECKKKYPHSPRSKKKLHSLDMKLSKMTLEQCYSEVKNILTDVYVAVSVNLDSKRKGEEKYESEDDLDVPDDSKSLTETELIDDGVHPLLQSEHTSEEDENDLVGKVEKILERSLSPDPKHLNDDSPLKAENCDHLPCSIWCASLPPAVKDTFKKYIQKFQSIKNFNQHCNQPMCLDRRRLFKRSISADDAPLYGRFIEDLYQTSTVESREMLLRRQDPYNYFRRNSSNTVKNGKKYGSWDLNQFANSNDSSMWGKFDGADSLWKPLPECNTANIHNQKLNLHKKGRETKWQRV